MRWTSDLPPETDIGANARDVRLEAKKSTTMEGRMALPITGSDGAIIGFFGRSLKDETPMLTFPNGLDPQAIFAPAGARIAGNISLDECSAPNPGSPTAPVSLSLMIGKTLAIKSMIQYPVSATAPIRRVGE